jgi:hypothetical protein
MSETRIQPKRDGTGTGEQLSEDEVFDVLSNERRRYAYEYLKRKDREDNGTIDLRELVDHVAAAECDKRPERLTTAERNRVSTALHQFHLPKMDDCGFVEYDSQRGTVELSEGATDLEVYLDVVPGPDVPWGLYYLGLAGLNAAVLVGVLLDAPPFALLPTTSWLTFAVASLVVSAVVHAYYTRRMRIGAENTDDGSGP